MKKEKCKLCKKQFIKIHARHVYCSGKCKSKQSATTTPKVEIQCSACKKKIQVPRKRLGKQENFFCSKDCEILLRRERGREDRVCEECHNIFSTRKSTKLRFCSTTCQGKWQSRTRVGEGSPTFNKNFTDRNKTCPFCKKEFHVDMKEKNKIFCSFSCKVKSNPKTMSYPHKEVANILKNNGIKFVNERGVGRYSLDILINSDLGIEIMGTYWHSDKRVYKNPIDEIQKKSINRDVRKNEVLLENNIKILYLWEKDIIERRDMCEKLILRYIHRSGNVDNFHSMNYVLEKNRLLLSDKIIDCGY